ncbi:hypothetical protein A9Q77_00175 [Marinomonas sp. 42_23_T18]|nr:hypothetical protein A9Q77_00175 [Marinomonas sp. 42_23_T18]
MKRATKAALLSALVFPGAGYFAVSKTKQALTFILLTLTGLSAIIYDSIYKAQIIAQKVTSGSLSLDANIIREEILKTQGVISPAIITAITFGIGALWIVAIIDGYRIGKSQDKTRND